MLLQICIAAFAILHLGWFALSQGELFHLKPCAKAAQLLPILAKFVEQPSLGMFTGGE